MNNKNFNKIEFEELEERFEMETAGGSCERKCSGGDGGDGGSGGGNGGNGGDGNGSGNKVDIDLPKLPGEKEVTKDLTAK